MSGSARSVRLDRVSDAVAQVEVDCALALVAFSDGRLLTTVRSLRSARDRLNRAIVTLNTRGVR